MDPSLMENLTSASSLARNTASQITQVQSVAVNLQNQLNLAAGLLTAAHTAIGINAPDGHLSVLDGEITSASTAAATAATALTAAVTNVVTLQALLVSAASLMETTHSYLENIDTPDLSNLS